MAGPIEDVRTPQFMLVLSSACPAACSYCFGQYNGPLMPPKTLESTLDFVASVAGSEFLDTKMKQATEVLRRLAG